MTGANASFTSKQSISETVMSFFYLPRGWNRSGEHGFWVDAHDV